MPKYVKVFENMADIGIKVAYLPFKESNKKLNLKYDFLLIEVDKFIYSVHWTSANNRRSIVESITKEYKKGDKIEEKHQLKIIANSLDNRNFNEEVPECLKIIPDGMIEVLTK